jgi:exopolyphosphatase/guanosine-5'-triphosphate,3'-diphosphate pyrophosphatase
MLHACGQHINLSAYHKHSWYLIRHGELLGYSEAEHLMVAAIARYHRRSLPKKRHESWQALQSRDNRRTVSDMALLLRLAVAIDRRPEPVVKSLVVKVKDEDLVLQLIGEKADQDLSLEQWSLESCTPILREITGLNLKLKVQE